MTDTYPTSHVAQATLMFHADRKEIIARLRELETHLSDICEHEIGPFQRTDGTICILIGVPTERVQEIRKAILGAPVPIVARPLHRELVADPQPTFDRDEAIDMVQTINSTLTGQLSRSARTSFKAVPNGFINTVETHPLELEKVKRLIAPLKSHILIEYTVRAPVIQLIPYVPRKDTVEMLSSMLRTYLDHQYVDEDLAEKIRVAVRPHHWYSATAYDGDYELRAWNHNPKLSEDNPELLHLARHKCMHFVFRRGRSFPYAG